MFKVVHVFACVCVFWYQSRLFSTNIVKNLHICSCEEWSHFYISIGVKKTILLCGAMASSFFRNIDSRVEWLHRSWAPVSAVPAQACQLGSVLHHGLPLSYQMDLPTSHNFCLLYNKCCYCCYCCGTWPKAFGDLDAAPGYWFLPPTWLSLSYCGHLWSELAQWEISFFLYLPLPYLPSFVTLSNK